MALHPFLTAPIGMIPETKQKQNNTPPMYMKNIVACGACLNGEKLIQVRE